MQPVPYYIFDVCIKDTSSIRGIYYLWFKPFKQIPEPKVTYRRCKIQVLEGIYIVNSEADYLLNSKSEYLQPAVRRVITTREVRDYGS